MRTGYEHRRRGCPGVLLLAPLLFLAHVAKAATPASWYADESTAATGATVSTSSGVALDKLASPPVNGAWAPVGRIEIKTGQSVTLRARLQFTPAPTPRSAAQFRIALLGSAGGSAALPAMTDLRGFTLTGGYKDNEWISELWERSSETPFPCAARGSKPSGLTKAAASSTPETSMRFVVTVTKKGPALFDVSGFWGTYPFSFPGLRTVHDYDAFRAVGFLNGKGTGVDRMSVERVDVAGP